MSEGKWLPPKEFAGTLPKAATGLRVEGPPKLPATVGRVFHGGRLTPGQLAGIVLDPDEHDEARALAVPERQGLMPGRDHARPEAVMAARKTGIPTYFGAWDREV
ncbi:hypothetical protein [Streptomyces sp. NPDC089915]|uniref:hypothetical protein n=1 Tax=Streptomyces sp. NPDC089915 TaxID=3155186 RepID=UPI00342DA369